ncbi:LOW QUALITY PROTEIN: riboflavin kinase-like [Pecten maximus]|uniref:LOW QUALITY PROTEIN: riboflavin kinase-like n=1 Tax=Pecten maximus TaxID=6579 RepID=UPI001458C7CC|nr:LOW QUALITY PROTEIN: riboflavin kinase-like [Pecten maximus]
MIHNLAFSDVIFQQITGTATSSENMSCFPYYTEGEVIKGFGRGSKELGIPTANFPEDVVKKLPEEIQGGVYYGWANVDNGPVYEMVMSIGNNPYYKNEKRSMETHIIHTFNEDFYGSTLKTVMLGFIRPMKNFSSLDELVTEIHADIFHAKEKLELPENSSHKHSNFFYGSDNKQT